MPDTPNIQAPSFEREGGFAPPETEVPKNQPAVERPEVPQNPETVADLAVNDAEAQYNQLAAEQDQGLARVDRAGDSLGLDKQAVQQQKQDKVAGPFQAFKTTAWQLFNTFKTTVKNTLAIGMGAATMTATAENRPAPGIEQITPSVRQEQVVSADQKIGSVETPGQAAASKEQAKTGEVREQESEKRILTEDELKQAVFTDENESSFIASDSTGGKFQEITTGDETNVAFDVKKVQEAAKKSKNLVATHTHPMESYIDLGYKAEDVEKMRKGELSIPPTPPSTLDVRTSVAVGHYARMANKGVGVTSRVYEPTGIWEYNADFNHPFVRAVESSFKKFDKGLKKSVSELPKKDRKLLESKGMKIPLPGQDIVTLDKNPQTEHIGEALDESLREKGLDTEFDRFDPVLNEMDMAAQELRAATMTGRSAETKKYLTEMYIGVCKRNGIDMKYTPGIVPSKAGVEAPAVPVENTSDRKPEPTVESIPAAAAGDSKVEAGAVAGQTKRVEGSPQSPESAESKSMPNLLETAGSRPEVAKILESGRFAAAKDPESFHTLFEEVQKSGSEDERLALAAAYRKFVGNASDGEVIKKYGVAKAEQVMFEAGSAAGRATEQLFRGQNFGAAADNLKIPGYLENFQWASDAHKSSLLAGRVGRKLGREGAGNFETRTINEVGDLNDAMLRSANSLLLSENEPARLAGARLRLNVTENARFLVDDERPFVQFGRGKFLFHSADDLSSTIEMFDGSKLEHVTGMTSSTDSVYRNLKTRADKPDLYGPLGPRERQIYDSILASGDVKKGADDKEKIEPGTMLFTTPQSAAHELQHQQLDENDALFSHWIDVWNGLSVAERRKIITEDLSGYYDGDEQKELLQYVDNPLNKGQMQYIRGLERSGQRVGKLQRALSSFISEHFAYSTDNEGNRIFNPKYEIKK